MADLFRGRKWDLVGYRNLWFAISLAIILPGLVFWINKGLNYGIDFTGGGLITYQLAQPVPSSRETETLARARQAIKPTGIKAQLQMAGTAARTDQLLVRTRVEPKPGQDSDAVLAQQREKMLSALRNVFPGITEAAGEMVSPVVSKELLWKAVRAVVFGCVFILVWIRLRYPDLKWAFSALVALVHDVLVLIGAFALTQKEINSPFVAAALTVMGYSVHDTIVIYDRIRENLRLRKGTTFAETANISLLETMPRSVNTVLTTELVLIAVFLLGGSSLRDFAFAMMVGITVGAYSSIFNASQLMAVFKLREERAIARRRAAAGRPAKAGGPTREVSRRAAPAPSARLGRAAESRGAGVAAAAGESASAAEQAAAADTGLRPERVPRAARRKLKAARGKRKRRF